MEGSCTVFELSADSVPPSFKSQAGTAVYADGFVYEIDGSEVNFILDVYVKRARASGDDNYPALARAAKDD